METSSPAAIAYLTVQDVLWIHFQLTKAPAPFRYAPLEESVNYQYAYGDSKDVCAQSARLLGGFRKLRPFDTANDATAFVSSLAFLALNGMRITLPDSEGAHWYGKIANGDVAGEKGVDMASTVGDGHGPNTVEAAVVAVLQQFPASVAAILGTVPA